MVIVLSWKIEVLQKAKTAFKHWEQIDHIRSFSRSVAFATARTGKIVKTWMEISAAASIIWMNLQMTITVLIFYGLVQCCDDTKCHVVTIWPILLKLYLCTMLYSTCAHIAMFYSSCNEPVHAEYNLSTRLCLTYIYSTVSSQPIHSYQQSYNKVVSNL